MFVLQINLVDYPDLLPEEQAFEVHILAADAQYVPVFPVEPEKEEEVEEEVVEEEDTDETEDIPAFAGVVVPTEPVVVEKVLDESDFAANEIREKINPD